MAGEKLQTVKKIYKARERRLARLLVDARAAKEKQEAQAESLRGMLNGYREDKRHTEPVRSDHLAMFHRFYQQVADTLNLHGVHLQKLNEAEARRRAQWQDAYRRSQAIEQLVDKQERDAELLERRRGRRPGPANPRDWSMLNVHEDNQRSSS